MSYAIAKDLLNLRPSARPGHVLYCTHEPLRERVFRETGLVLEDAWECDLICETDDGPHPWSELGRVTDMGHAEFLAGGTDRRTAGTCPFHSLEEARLFNAVREYGLPEMDVLTAYYERTRRERQRVYPNQVVTGGYYKTLFSGALEVFGWDMLLQLAADLDAFENMLDSIFEVSLHHCAAWARTGMEVFLLHDDMVWAQGPFMNPAFHRRFAFPRYTHIVQMMHKAGKKVLFCSDGNWTCFIDDVAATGADGFVFESAVPFATMAARFGRTHVLVGSAIDCRTLTFGNLDDISGEIDATLDAARACSGLFVAVGNHIPANVPVENALFYSEYLRKNWRY